MLHAGARRFNPPVWFAIRGELDFDVNRRAESEIQGLARKVSQLDDKIDDLADLLRIANTR